MKREGMVRAECFAQAAVMTVSCIGMLDEIAGLQFSVAVAVLVLLVLAVLSFFHKRRQLLAAIFVVLGILCLVNLAMREWCIVGMKDLWGHFAAVLGGKFEIWIPIWSVTESEFMIKGAHILIQASIGVVFAVIFLCVTKFVNRFFAFFLMLFAVVIQLLFGTKSSSVYFIVFVGGCLLLLGYGYTTERKEEKRASGFGGLVAITVAICCVCSVFLPTQNESQVLKNIQRSFSKVVETLQYGKDTSGCTSGDFSYVPGKCLEEEAALEITMEKPYSMYLRGFVGTDFSENRWKENDGKKQYKSAELFYWLHKEGFYAEGQLAEAFESFELKKETCHVDIKNLRASGKYKYIPYEYQHTESGVTDQLVIHDGAVHSTGKKDSSEYSYEMVPGLITGYPNILNNLMSGKTSGTIRKYCRQEQHYNHYVYDTYLGLDDETEQLLKKCLGSWQTDGEHHASYEKAKEAILEFLSAQIRYNEMISGKSNDFLREFLEERQEGYDIHYATAATLMFRYYGIPARYVEGYLITPQDTETMQSGEAWDLPISNAHAWAEYYQDGVGWIPFEVTPPYIGVMDSARVFIKTKTENQTVADQKKQIIKEDNYEQKTDREKQKMNLKKIKNALPFIILAILVMLAALYIRRAWRILHHRRALFLQENVNRAVISLFTYMMEILFSHVILRENKSLAFYENEIQKYEPGGEYCYQDILDIYRRARFSDCACTEQDKLIVESFVKMVSKKVYVSLKWYKKVKWKFWDFVE